MARTPWFESPFLLGFERLQEMAERAAHVAADGYPPYNIETLSEDRLRVSVAVAGFEADDLAVELRDRHLVISGGRADGEASGADEPRAFLHRGIAARRFRRTFLLADGCEVDGASLENGLLHVDVRLARRAPEVKRIAIRANGAASEAFNS